MEICSPEECQLLLSVSSVFFRAHIPTPQLAEGIGERAPCQVIEVVNHSIMEIVLQAPVLAVWYTASLYGGGCTDKRLHLGSIMKINPGRRPSLIAHSIHNSSQILSIYRKIVQLLPLNIPLSQHPHFDLIS